MRAVGQDICRNRVRSNDAERKAPGSEPASVDHRIKSGEQEKAPAAAVERPGRRPDALDTRTKAIGSQRNGLPTLDSRNLHCSMGCESESQQECAGQHEPSQFMP